MESELLTRVAERLSRATRVTVLTGAGISAGSGVPTFRGPGGLWRSFRPEELATPEAFARDPRLVWEWYDWRRQCIAGCAPNRAHEVLTGWSRRLSGYTLLTQNVDGLHERAGHRDTIRLHGSIWDVACWSRCAASPPVWRHDEVPLKEVPLRCPRCNGLARPAVVWFGEALDPRVVAAAVAATTCDVFITAGTSALVYPAAGFLHDARARGAFTVDINLDPTPATHVVDAVLPGPAAEVLDRLDAALAAL